MWQTTTLARMSRASSTLERLRLLLYCCFPALIRLPSTPDKHLTLTYARPVPPGKQGNTVHSLQDRDWLTLCKQDTKKLVANTKVLKGLLADEEAHGLGLLQRWRQQRCQGRLRAHKCQDLLVALHPHRPQHSRHVDILTAHTCQSF